MSEIQARQTGLIAWFAYNPVAANLLMVFVILGGIFSYNLMTKRMTPDIQPNIVQISVPYLGAAPQEVEEGVVIKIEEAIQDVKGIKSIRASAREGVGTVSVELKSAINLDDALNEIKIKVDSIATFPNETEKPVISKFERSSDVLWLSLFGDMSQRTRQTIAREVRDEIMSLPDVNKAEIIGSRPYEIAIEISEETLQAYSLTMSDVANAVRNYSIDLPGGSIRSDGGDIRLRTIGQAYSGLDFSNLILRTNADGTRLLLGDVANINDGFVETDGYARFDGKPATVIRVKSLGEQNDIKIASVVRKYMEQKRLELPSGAEIDVWGDGSVYLQQRIDMMTSNMLMGGFLVLLLLALFLRPIVALWVLVGIPVCFFGAFLFMDKVPFVATNINFLSLFGLILVLGIVVDDAIIIGESVYSEIKANGHSTENVIIGAKRVAVPATFGVLTTIAAFVPMLTLSSVAAPFFESIAVVVILCLIFSLVESKWILPAHLAHMKYRPYDARKTNRFGKIQHAIRESMESFANKKYQPILEKVVKHRYLTLVTFLTVLTVAIGAVSSGVVKTEVFPTIANDSINGSFSLNEGSSPAARDKVVEILETAARKVDADLSQSDNEGKAIVQHVLSWTSSDISGGMLIELTRGETRNINAWDYERAWREAVGDLPGVKELRFVSSTGVGGDAAMNFRLTGSNYEYLQLAAKELAAELTKYDGVYDIRSSDGSGSQEIKLKLKPGAESLGVTLVGLGRQVRQAFYGEEAQRIQRGKDEIKVMVRYPKDQRRSITDLETMRIRTPSGEWVPFTSVAEFTIGDSFSSIQRENRKKAVNVRADIDSQKTQSGTVQSEITNKFLPEMLAKYPGVKHEVAGQRQAVQEFQSELILAFSVALAMIYILIAIPLKSYLQPLMVMSVIPFGFIGAVVGHLIFDKSFSMMSAFGLVALSGVVVNDSLIMVDFVNRAREQGHRLTDAILNAGVKRFRAIMLTSLTTFFGLLPIMFEKSLQAQVIIPMAISLAFGIMFATFITLIFIPALYMILEDFKRSMKRVYNGIFHSDQLANDRIN